MYYKLTDQKMQTRKGYQWELGKWNKVSGKGGLCSDGWLHCYNSPLLAVLLNPTHANIRNPRLFEIEVDGDMLANRGLKFGFTRMKLVREIPLPEITVTQRIAFSILCTKRVCKAKIWNDRVDKWLSGEDRSPTGIGAPAAYVAAIYAAYADAAPVDLIKIAEQAMTY